MPTVGSDCPTGKEQFTKDGARDRRDALRGTGNAELSLHVFRCDYCQCYHVGHTGRKRDIGRRRAGRR